MPVWATTTLQNTELDMSPADGGGYKRPAWESRAALLKFFDDNVATARAQIAKTSDAEFMVGWTLKNAGQALFTMPRVAVVRTWVMNHILHHRGQLSVYLRLLDVPVPSIYGPSADEQGACEGASLRAGRRGPHDDVGSATAQRRAVRHTGVHLCRVAGLEDRSLRTERAARLVGAHAPPARLASAASIQPRRSCSAGTLDR